MLRNGSRAVLVIISARYEWVAESLFRATTVLGNVHTQFLYGQGVIVVEVKGKGERLGG